MSIRHAKTDRVPVEAIDLGRRRFGRSAVCLALLSCGLLDRAGAEALPAADTVGAALAALAGNSQPSERVRISLPELVEDGTVVPVSIATDLPHVHAIYVLADSNPMPIAAEFHVGQGVAPRIAVRIKLADSGRVYGAVRTGQGLYWTSAATEVVSGGCG